MPEMSGADPTRPTEHEHPPVPPAAPPPVPPAAPSAAPPAAPSDNLPVPVKRPRKGAGARMGAGMGASTGASRRKELTPVPPTGAHRRSPNPSDLLLFSGMTASAAWRQQNGSGAAAGTGPGPGTGPGNSGGPAGPGGSGPGGRGPSWAEEPWDQEPPPLPKKGGLIRNTVLLGVGTLAFGIVLAMIAGPAQHNADQAAAPKSTLPQPPLPAFPAQGTDTEPGDVTDASDDTPSGTDGAFSELSPADAPARLHPSAAAAATGGSSGGAAGGSDDAKGSGKEGGGSGSDSGSGSGSGSGASSGPGTGSGTGGSGSGGGSSATPPAASSRKRAMQSVNYPDRYWNIRGNLGFLDTVSRDSATLTIVDGLAKSDCYSFALGGGRYLRHSSFRLRSDANDGSTAFKRDATFCPRKTPRGDTLALESYNYPGRFIRHRDFQLWLDPYQHSPLYQADTTFRMVKG
ncbi:AbfB domain-containing protein [Streptomyces sp. NPDC091212]|uniref:AbfB domain-containing protein n=1 Tax=Streptomyces sp. NPDC091212 TaxID=3155191 RepID=UPI003430685B